MPVPSGGDRSQPAQPRATTLANVDEVVDDLAQHAEAFRSLSEKLLSPPSLRPAPSGRKRRSPRRRGQGRPSRAQQAPPELLAAAPFPELVTEPADRVCSMVRRMSDIHLLRSGHAFELEHDRRVSVLRTIEDRLRRLGHPLGGPADPPLAGYDRQPVPWIMQALAGGDRSFAAHVYAWEWYHQRRQAVLAAAESVCGPAGREMVKATSPHRTPASDLPEPFPGFDLLSASPQQRQVTRETLRAQDRDTLLRTLAYEKAKKRRVIMIQAIETALRVVR